jgi:prenyltransferase beta subunit
MFAASAYVVAISAMVFCAISALTLINTVGHLDSPDARELPETVRHKVAV